MSLGFAQWRILEDDLLVAIFESDKSEGVAGEFFFLVMGEESSSLLDELKFGDETLQFAFL